jgi:hypothetical protein
VAAQDTTRPVYVLSIDAVRWGIAELKRTRVHPFFLAYLHLRQRASEQGVDTGIQPEWDRLGEYLAVRGGPPGKPFYRPVWNGNVSDPSHYWLNRNIAGSYAPSSLRTVPRMVIDTVGSEFSLLPDHAELAKKHLLYDGTVSAFALAAFFYRDFGFVTSEPDDVPGRDDLVAVLVDDFGLDIDDRVTLFDPDPPAETSVGQWFVDISDDAIGAE